jgi:hypothetical protein
MQSDALATPFVLTKHKTRSLNMATAHHLLLQQERYRNVARCASISHLFGDSNPFSDAVSRSLWKRFFALCSAMKVTPVEVQAPQALTVIIEQLVAMARLHGERVRTSTYVRPPPVLPAEMLGLGRRTPACEEADAVAISARLLRLLNSDKQANPRPSPRPATLHKQAMHAPRPGISARLLEALAAPPHSVSCRAQEAQATDTHATTHRPATATTRCARAPKERTVKQPRPIGKNTSMDTKVIAGLRLVSVPAPLSRPPTTRKLTLWTGAAREAAAARGGPQRLRLLLQHAKR